MSNKYRIYTVGKMLDEDIKKLFFELWDSFENANLSFSYGDMSVPHDELDELLDGGKGTKLSAVDLDDSGSIKIYFRRGISTETNGTFDNNREPSAYLDEILIWPVTGPYNNRVPSSVSDVVKAERIIKKYHTLKMPTGEKTQKIETLDLLQAEVSSLAQMQREMISAGIKRQKEWEEFTTQKREEIEAESKSQLNRIEEESNARSADFESEKKAHLKQIDKLQKELDTAKKAVDDRNHMHVRRELRQKITDDISNVISGGVNPPGSTLKNIAIVSFTILCALVAGAFAWQNFEAFTASTNIDTDTTLMWFLAIKGTIGAIATIGFLVYAMGWLRNSYLRDVSKAHELQRYGLDINRASWVIETIMEMTGKEGRVLPEKWIEGSCHGLFHVDGDDSSNVTSLEALGAIMNVAGKVEVGPEGPKIEINRRGAKKIASSLDS